MQHQPPDGPAPQPDVGSEQPLKMENTEHDHDQYTGRNRRALEVFYFPALVGERIGGGVEAGKTADSASHEIEQDRNIQGSPQPNREAERGGRKPERNYVGQ